MEIADGIYLAEDRDKCGEVRAVADLRCRIKCFCLAEELAAAQVH